MDEIKVKTIKCPICKGNKCFEDSHTEENGNVELTEGLCYNCGYTSNSTYSADSIKHEEMMPKIIVALKILDTDNKIFGYPSMLQTTKGYIFPEVSADDGHGFSAPIVEIEEEDLDKLPPGSEGVVGDLVIALWLGKRFPKHNFYEACNNLGLTMDRHEEVDE